MRISAFKPALRAWTFRACPDFGEDVKGDPLEPSITIQKGAGMGLKLTRAFPGESQGKVENVISKRLIHRIGKAIMTKTLFHAYIVLPVHPEGGGLDNPAIVTQVHFRHASEEKELRRFFRVINKR